MCTSIIGRTLPGLLLAMMNWNIAMADELAILGNHPEKLAERGMEFRRSSVDTPPVLQVRPPVQGAFPRYGTMLIEYPLYGVGGCWIERHVLEDFEFRRVRSVVACR
jgi:hypothetical protein